MLPLSRMFDWDVGPDGKQVTDEHDKHAQDVYIGVWHLESLAKMCLINRWYLDLCIRCRALHRLVL